MAYQAMLVEPGVEIMKSYEYTEAGRRRRGGRGRWDWSARRRSIFFIAFSLRNEITDLYSQSCIARRPEMSVSDDVIRGHVTDVTDSRRR